MKLLPQILIATLLGAAVLYGIIFVRTQMAATTPPDHPETVYDKEVDGQAIAALWNTQTGHFEQLSMELQQGQSELKRKVEELNAEKRRFENEKKELKKLQADVENARKHLNETITMIENMEVKNLRSQAKSYSNMDPGNVIKVFATMDDVEVVKILYFMGSDVQSEIFQAMIEANPEADLSSGKITGAAKVARLNEMLKFTLPPKK